MRYADPSGHRLDIDGPRGPITNSAYGISGGQKPYVPPKPKPKPSGSGGTTAPAGGGAISGGGSDDGSWEEPYYNSFEFVLLRYRSAVAKKTANFGTHTPTTDALHAAGAAAQSKTVAEKEKSKTIWWDVAFLSVQLSLEITFTPYRVMSGMTEHAISFIAGAASAFFDNSAFGQIKNTANKIAASQQSSLGTPPPLSTGFAPTYDTPFGKQNAFAAGQLVGHVVSTVFGILKLVLGTTGSIGGTVITTTGIGAPVGLSAVAVSAIAIADGASRVASAGEVIRNGDPNIHFVKPEESSQSNPITVNVGQQNKHIPGTNEHKTATSGGTPRSTINGNIDDIQKLLDQGAGTGTPIGTQKERVDFGKVIGQFVDAETGKAVDTTVGIIHYGQRGAHIVPARPN